MTAITAVWNEALQDDRLDPWQESFTHTRILVHVDDPRLAAGAEFFAVPNRGMTLGEQCRRAIANGHKLWLVLDNFYGNGRDGAISTSPVRPGSFHRSHSGASWAEAFNEIMRWPDEILDHVEYFQVHNEPEYQPNHNDPEHIQATMEFCAGFLTAGKVDRMRSKGWKIVVSPEQAAECKPWQFDAVDDHLIEKTPAEAAAVVRHLVRTYPGKEILVGEGYAEHPRDGGAYRDAVLVAGASGYSGFTGTLTDELTHWNGQAIGVPSHWTHFTEDGITPRGQSWAEYHGIEWPPSGPVDPPVPAPETDLEKLNDSLAEGDKLCHRSGHAMKRTKDALVEIEARLKRLEGA